MLDALRRPTAMHAALMMTITTLCWSGNFVVGRWAAGHIPPLTLSWVRWTGASLVMALLAWRHIRRDWPVVREHWPLMLLFGLTGTGFFNALQYLALNFTTATSAGIINSSGPILIAIASFLLFGDRVRWVQATGILISLSGVLVVIAKGELGALTGLALNIGDLIMLVAMITASIYAAYMRKRPAMHPLSFALVTFLVAAVINLPVATIELALGAHVDVSRPSAAAVLYVVIVPSVIAYLCFNRGIEILGGTRAGTFLHLIPLFTAILAMVFLGEQPAAYHGAGFALILSGIWLATRYAAPMTPAARATPVEGGRT
jgi:drug/metabolite transporter (DMT)-like permease